VITSGSQAGHYIGCYDGRLPLYPEPETCAKVLSVAKCQRGTPPLTPAMIKLFGTGSCFAHAPGGAMRQRTSRGRPRRSALLAFGRQFSLDLLQESNRDGGDHAHLLALPRPAAGSRAIAPSCLAGEPVNQ